jgi:hypothetical protein
VEADWCRIHVLLLFVRMTLPTEEGLIFGPLPVLAVSMVLMLSAPW